MATLLVLPLVTSTGSNISVNTNDVVYARNDSNSKAVFTYVDLNGDNKTVTLTISIVDLQAMATQELFIEPNLTDGADWLYNNTRVVKMFDYGNSTTKVYYNTDATASNKEFILDDTVANISTDCTTTIKLDSSVQTQSLYINYALIRNYTQTQNPTSSNLTLSSSTLASAGTGVTQIAGTLAGGTFINAATILVDTTKAISGTVTAAGTGADPSLTLHVAGGAGTAAQMSFNSKIVSLTATPVAAGTGYVPGDTVNPNGGTGTKGVITITHTKVVGTVTVVGAGSGGTPGLTTFTGVSGTGTKFQITGTIGGGGTLSGALTLTVAGDYTVNPSTLTATAITGGSLTGATVSVTMGALTTTLTIGGVYTVNPTAITASATTALTGTGTGMTSTFVMGVNAILGVSVAGSYTVNPTLTDNAVTTGATGATVTIVMGVNTYHITDGGDYSAAPTNPVTITLAGSTGITLTGTFNSETTTIKYDDKQNASTVDIYVKQTPVEIAALIAAL